MQTNDDSVLFKTEKLLMRTEPKFQFKKEITKMFLKCEVAVLYYLRSVTFWKNRLMLTKIAFIWSKYSKNNNITLHLLLLSMLKRVCFINTESSAAFFCRIVIFFSGFL